MKKPAPRSAGRHDVSVEQPTTLARRHRRAAATLGLVVVALLGLACAPTGPTPPIDPAPALAPAEMGSGDHVLGLDPDAGDQVGFWLNLAGPGTSKSYGDRRQSRTCLQPPAFGCSPVTGGHTNDEYSPDGYTFGVESHPGAATEPLRIEVFDGATVPVGDRCNLNLPSAAELATLSATYPDADVRYAGGTTPYCTGDQVLPSTPSAPGTRTTFIVREPDATSWTDLDNPVVDAATCRPTTLPYFAPAEGTPFQLLQPADGIRDDQAMVADDGVLTFAELFRRWAEICEIPAAQVVPGTYIVQARSNADASSPLTEDASLLSEGMNRFSMRGGTGASARADLSTFVTGPGPETPIEMVRVPPQAFGRTLRLEVYDIDGGIDALHLSGPGGQSLNCTITLDRTDTIDTTTDGCAISLYVRNLNGRLLGFDIPIPADPDCVPESCWVTARIDHQPWPADSITWSASFAANSPPTSTTSSSTPSSTSTSTSTTSTSTTSTSTTTTTTTTTLPPVPAEPGVASAYQNGPAHLGSVVDPEVDVASLTRKWSATFPGPASYSVIARDMVFVTAKTATSGYGTTVHALDIDDGAERWSADLGGTYWDSSLAYENGVVFALNYNGRLRAFDSATGQLKWEQQFSQSGFSAPVTVRNNYVYAAGGNLMHAVNAMTGAIVWSRNVANANRSSPAVDATGIYTSHTCNTQRRSLFGDLIWELPRSCSGGSGRQVTLDSANQRLYVRQVDLGAPRWENRIVHTDTGAIGPTIPMGSPYAVDVHGAFTVASGVLVKVDPTTGAQVWSMGGDVDDTLVGAPNILNDVVIVGGRSGKVYGLSAADGTRVWSARAGAPVSEVSESGGGAPTAGTSIGLGRVTVSTDTGLTLFAT